jgi:hypothetical protein
MSYTEARSHFEKGRLNTVDKGVMEMLDGFKHLSHAIEEDLRTLEQRNKGYGTSVTSSAANKYQFRLPNSTSSSLCRVLNNESTSTRCKSV